MPVTASRVTVDTTPVRVARNDSLSVRESDETQIRVLVKNITGTAPITLDGLETVEVNGSFQWDPDDGPLEIELEPQEELWAVATAPQTVDLLRQGR